MTIPRDDKEPSPDDDPTGVRALLSSLPEPDPMPTYLVERITASLAAEQSRRAASFSGAAVAPLLATQGRRSGRLLLALAGAAATFALVGALAGNLITSDRSAATSSRAAAAITSNTGEAAGGATLRAHDESKALSASGTTLQPQLLQIQQSQTRYTSADFVAQARALRSTAFKEVLAGFPGVGAVGTPAGLTACLSAIGAGRAEVVRADLAFYEGQPAVIIVTTSHGIPTAYALGRGCTGADGAVLRPATPLR